MYEGMIEVVKVNKVIVVYCEDNLLIYGGVMYEGKCSKELGILGILNICEFV